MGALKLTGERVRAAPGRQMTYDAFWTLKVLLVRSVASAFASAYKPKRFDRENWESAPIIGVRRGEVINWEFGEGRNGKEWDSPFLGREKKRREGCEPPRGLNTPEI